MFLVLTPSSFFFSVVYFILIIIIFCADDFVTLWVLIEFLILVFIGLAYSTSRSSFSYVLIYFLVQTLSSFSILLFWAVKLYLVITTFLLINLALFPFYAWFLSASYYFSSFLLFLSIGLHNLPPFILVLFHLNSAMGPATLWLCLFSLFSSALVSGILIVSTLDLRFMLISSSVGSTSWIILSALALPSFSSFTFFFFFYLLFLLSVISSFSNFLSTSFLSSSDSFRLAISVFLLSGFPPSPLFFANFLVFFSSFSLSPLFTLLLLTATSISLVGYLLAIFRLLVLCYSNSSTLVISLATN